MEKKNLILGFAGLAILGGGYLIYKKNIDAKKLSTDKLAKDTANAAAKLADTEERQDLYKQIYAQIVVLCPSFIARINSKSDSNKAKILQMMQEQEQEQMQAANAVQQQLFRIGVGAMRSANGIISESTEVMKPQLVKDTYSTDAIGINACAYDLNATLMPTFEKMSISELKLILAYYKNMDILSDSLQYPIYIELFNKYQDSGISLQD